MSQPPGFEQQVLGLQVDQGTLWHETGSSGLVWKALVYITLVWLYGKPPWFIINHLLYHFSSPFHPCICWWHHFHEQFLFTGSTDYWTPQHCVFALKQLSTLDYVPRIAVKHLPNGSLLLTQSKYILDLLSEANMADYKPISSPMVTIHKLTDPEGSPFYDPFFV